MLLAAVLVPTAVKLVSVDTNTTTENVLKKLNNPQLVPVEIPTTITGKNLVLVSVGSKCILKKKDVFLGLNI